MCRVHCEAIKRSRINRPITSWPLAGHLHPTEYLNLVIV